MLFVLRWRVDQSQKMAARFAAIRARYKPLRHVAVWISSRPFRQAYADLEAWWPAREARRAGKWSASLPLERFPIRSTSLLKNGDRQRRPRAGGAG